VGNHQVRLESKLDCESSSRNKYADIIVYESGGSVTPPPKPPEPPEITETSVFISPTQLDIEIFTGKTVEILIQSPEDQTFGIEVLDLPDDWVNCPKEVDVDGKERVYAYVVPKELGEYTFRIKVRAGEETFEETIELYVAPEGELSGDGDGFTGFIAAGGSWIVGLIVLVIIVAVVLVYYGYKRFRKKRYEEHVYGEREIPKTPEFRPYEPSSGMMKGSVGNVSQPESHKNKHAERQPIRETERYSDLSYFPKEGKDFFGRQSAGKIFR